MSEITTILFDADGVLFDATELHKVTLNKALAPWPKYIITDDEHTNIFNGLPTRVKLDILSEMKGLPRHLHGEIESIKQSFTLEMIPQIIKPDIELGNALHNLRYQNLFRLAICSNARMASVIKMAECAGIISYFNIILGNESVLRTKPAPDIYLLAAKQLGVNPIECAIVEDSPKGIVAAIGAGPGLLVPVKGSHETVKRLREYFNL